MKFKKVICGQCSGEGAIRCPLAPAGGLTLCEENCHCKGKGEIPCPRCGGKGFLKLPK